MSPLFFPFSLFHSLRQRDRHTHTQGCVGSSNQAILPSPLNRSEFHKVSLFLLNYPHVSSKILKILATKILDKKFTNLFKALLYGGPVLF